MNRSRLWAAALPVLAVTAGCASSTTHTTDPAPVAPSTRVATVTSTVSSSPSASAKAATTSPGSIAATPTSAPTAPAGPAGPDGCETQHLKLTRQLDQGAAGTIYTTMALTNIGTVRCVLQGYPGVSVVDANGNIVQKPATRDVNLYTRGNGTASVILDPGHLVAFQVASVDVNPDVACPGIRTGVAFVVYPPNQTTTLRLAQANQEACQLRVGPVYPAG